MTGTLVTRFAHLSDVHLGPITGFGPRFWNIKRGLGYVNWRRNRRDCYRRDVLDRIVADIAGQGVDHIIVSGDLCNIGLPSEMAHALTWLQTLGPPERVSVVPGNHDIYTTIGNDPGTSRWADYMAGDPHFFGSAPSVVDRRPQVHQIFPYVRLFGGIALIGLNSAIETPPFIAAGQLGADQRSRLASILAETAADGLFRLVVIHHAPLPGQTRRSHALNDAAAFRDLLATHGAELVVHGHLHRNIRASLLRPRGGTVPIVGVSSASTGLAHGDEPLARYNLLDVGRDRIDVIGRGLRAADGPIAELEHFHFRVTALADNRRGLS